MHRKPNQIKSDQTKSNGIICSPGTGGVKTEQNRNKKMKNI